MTGKEKLRLEISKVLVKWSMPTRQVAINEIMTLIDKEIGKLREEYKDIVQVKINKPIEDLRN